MRIVKNFSAGFSMVELLVVVIIIPIMVGISISQFNRQAQEVKLDQQADMIVDALELAKKKTVASDLGLYVGACPTFNGYIIQFTPSSPYTGFNMNICCAGVCTSGVANYAVQSTLTVTLSGPHPIQFVPLNPGTTGAANTIITVRNPAISKCILVTVTPQGLINKGVKVAC